MLRLQLQINKIFRTYKNSSLSSFLKIPPGMTLIPLLASDLRRKWTYSISVLLFVTFIFSILHASGAITTHVYWIVCDIQNNHGRGRGYQPRPKAGAYNPYRDLDCTESKNELIASASCYLLHLYSQYFTPVVLSPHTYTELYVISKIITVEGGVISRGRRLGLITLTETLNIPNLKIVLL